MITVTTRRVLRAFAELGFRQGRSGLRFNSFNQNISLGDSTHYNVGSQNFTIYTRLTLLNTGVATFFSKGLIGTSQRFYSIGRGGGSFNQIAFRFGGNELPAFDRIIGISGSNISTYHGKTTDFFFFRVLPENPTFTQINDPQYYFIEINGVVFPCTTLFSTGSTTPTFDPFSNTLAATQGGNFTGANPEFAFYRKALSQEERDNIRLRGAYTESEARLINNFDSFFGRVNLDKSAVANNGTLNANFTDEELGAIDPATNLAWHVAMLVTRSTTADNKPIHTVVTSYNLTKISRTANSLIEGTFTHWRGTVQVGSTYTLSFVNDVYTSGLAVEEGDELRFLLNGHSASAWNAILLYN